jgi:trans-aconitate 2-methyltransferase
MAWDPKTYLTFGSGPGNSTALLAARWPDADIEGVDSSPEMLEEARASGVRARWTHADIASWEPSSRFDVIYSNATFQWLPDHANLLPRLVSYLTPDGVFAFQVPRNFDEPCHTLIHEVATNGTWAAKLKGVRDWWNVLAPEAYFDILEPRLRHIDIWETRYVQTLTGEDAVYRWMMGTGLRPFANALEGDEREAFLSEYRKRVGAAYPMRASGVTLYPFQRLFCVARK